MAKQDQPVDPFAHRAPAGWWSQLEQQQFAKKDDDEDDDDGVDLDDDDEDEDDDDEDDPDAGKTPEQLAAEVKSMRAALAKANGQSAKSRQKRKELQSQLDAALAAQAGGKKKRKADDDEDDDDTDAKIEQARAEARKEATQDIISAKAESLLQAAGATADGVDLLVGRLDFDDLEYDPKTRQVDGLDDAIDELKTKYPTLFKKSGKGRRIAGDDQRDGDGGKSKKPMTATERQAAALRGR